MVPQDSHLLRKLLDPLCNSYLCSQAWNAPSLKDFENQVQILVFTESPMDLSKEGLGKNWVSDGLWIPIERMYGLPSMLRGKLASCQLVV